MESFNYWFLLALILLAMEMATGTFYLLMLSIAMAMAGTAAWLGAGSAAQLTLCALVVISGTIGLRIWKKARPDKDGSIDIGQPVQILSWLDNGMARVLYRGAEWDAEPESADMPRDGTFYISQMRGSSLILTHRKL